MTTFERLIDVFNAVFEEDTNIDVSAINESSHLINDIGLNSIGMLYMAMAIEEEFEIKFQNDDFKMLATMGDVITLIESKA